LLAVLAGVATAAAQEPPARPPADGFGGQTYRRIPVRPGGPMAPQAGAPRRARDNKQCISINTVGAAQLIGDRTIEITMKGGRRWRMILAEDCPALSFYQGFYYQQRRAGELCAGRDAIGARSGGECGIAAIVPANPPRKRRRR
jgi:hypothetical protein